MSIILIKILFVLLGIILLLEFTFIEKKPGSYSSFNSPDSVLSGSDLSRTKAHLIQGN